MTTDKPESDSESNLLVEESLGMQPKVHGTYSAGSVSESNSIIGESDLLAHKCQE